MFLAAIVLAAPIVFAVALWIRGNRHYEQTGHAPETCRCFDQQGGE